MRAEAWIFAICTVFFLLVAPAYWFIAGDPTGTSALTMTFLLTLLVTLYLAYLGIGGQWVGSLLWPAVALHAVLTFLLARARFAGVGVNQ